MLPSYPLVSVIIPCYNYGRYLSEALESVYSQTYTHWECIVVDDGSTDTTSEVGNRYAVEDKRFRYIYQQNGGVSGARNTALKVALGEYIQFLDADDLLEPYKLRLQVGLLESNPLVDLVYSDIIFFRNADQSDKAGPALLSHKEPVSGSGEKLLKCLVEDNLFLPGCVFFRYSLCKETGLFTKGIEGIEDWDFFYRAALKNKTFFHDDRPGTRLLARGHTTNASNNSFRMLTHKIKARKRLMEMTKQITGSTPAVFSGPFLNRVMQEHSGFLSRDKARLHLFYGSLLKGLINVGKHAFFTRALVFPLYDGAYWIKERLKKKRHKNNPVN